MSSKSSRKSLSQTPTPEEYDQFSKAHQNVLLERIEKNVSAIAEGHTLLNEKIDRLHLEMTDRFEKVDVRFDKVDARLDKVENRLGKVENRLDKVEVIVLEILERLKALEVRVEKLESKWGVVVSSAESLSDAEERFQQLERRIAVLEAHAH